MAIIFYTRYKISIWRKRVKRETEEVSESVDMAFKKLKKEIEEQIEFLDGKPGLNKNEIEIQDKLRKILNASKRTINKEIKDVDKEIE
jgi:thymidylate kinase